MRTLKRITPILAAVLVLIVGLSFQRTMTARQQPRAAAATKWEYKVVPTNQVDPFEFNNLGSEGWEFAGTVTTVGRGESLYLIFKRPKP